MFLIKPSENIYEVYDTCGIIIYEGQMKDNKVNYFILMVNYHMKVNF